MLGSGCAFTHETVAVTYLPQDGVSKVAGAGDVQVKVEVRDVRPRTDRISSKRNGYGMECAPMTSEEDVTTIVSNAIQTELRNRGFRVDGQSVLVIVDLIEFYCDFKMGLFAADADGRVAMEVQVKKKGGKVFYKRTVEAEHHKGAGVTSHGNVKVVMEAALQKAMHSLMEDTAMIDAILKASKD